MNQFLRIIRRIKLKSFGSKPGLLLGPKDFSGIVVKLVIDEQIYTEKLFSLSPNFVA